MPISQPWVYQLLEKDLLPDNVIRWGIQKLLAQKIKREAEPTQEKQQQRLQQFIDELKTLPIAIETDQANAQHYEVPSQFYHLTLGPNLKYSSGYWNQNTKTLADAEVAMLELYCKRAELKDGQTILDLGCGWGSLSLYLAKKYPSSKIIGLSNSKTQKQWIDEQAKNRGLNNLEIRTANIVHYDIPEKASFDAIISIEMFEHMKNYQLLLKKISTWLKPKGKLFVHIFTHKIFAYHYEDTDGTDWLTRYFFAGGTMPSNHLLFYFQGHLKIKQHWLVDGTHYEKTANAWLKNQYQNRAEIWPLLEKTYGKNQAKKWWVYWKLFFLACAELWGYQDGNQWMVAHYLFEKPMTE